MDHRPSQGRLEIEPPERVAIVRATRLGDLLCGVPMLRSLRALWPAAQVTLVGLPWARVLLERYPRYLDGFLEFPGWPGIPERKVDPVRLGSFREAAAAARFDLAVQAHGDGSVMNGFLGALQPRRSAGFHPPDEPSPGPDFLPYPSDRPEPLRLLALAEHLGARDLDPALEFPLLAPDRTEAARLREDLGIDGRAYACLHAGGSTPARRWPARAFARVADELTRAGLEVVLTGTAEEADLGREVMRGAAAPLRSVTGRTSLGSLAALLSGARLLVTNDTGVSHLAAALGTASVVVFTGSDRARWAPLAAGRHLVVGAGTPDRAAAGTTPFARSGEGTKAPEPALSEVLAAVQQQLRSETLVLA